MSDISSVYSSTSRVTGMYSEMDTDSIVKNLLKVEQSRIDRQEQEKTAQNWYNDALGDVQDLVEEFKNTYLSALGEKSIASSSVYKSFSVTMDDTSAVSVSAASGAVTGSYTINSVTRLAKNAEVSSTGISAFGTGISEYNTTALKDLKFATPLQFDYKGQISFSINGSNFTFSSDTTLQSMLNTINADEKAGVTMKYSRLTDGFTITADRGGADSSVTIRNISGNAFGLKSAFGIGTGTTGDEFAAQVSSIVGIVGSGAGISRNSTLGELDTAISGALFGEGSEISFSINGKSFSFGSETTILDMMYSINTGDAGVIVRYDDVAETFSITSADKGEDAFVSIVNTTGNAFGASGAFGIKEGTTSGTVLGSKGQDAVCTIEGVTVKRSENTFTIDGLSYTLKKVTGEAVDFTVSKDFSKTVDAMKAFAGAYNELVDKLSGLLQEKDYSADYKPLTAAQEDEMSENQIEKWNEKAKSGLLRNNKDLERFLRSVKSAFLSSLGGTGKTMSSIGITTGSYFSDDAGKILVNEDVLRAALEKNSDTVLSMFTNSKEGSKGLVYKISDSVNSYLKKLDKDQKSTAKRVGDLDDKIKELEDGLDTLADRYYARFSAMEQSLSKMYSMSSMLSSMIAGR
jgi:flagellar hook-associated protein 2